MAMCPLSTSVLASLISCEGVPKCWCVRIEGRISTRAINIRLVAQTPDQGARHVRGAVLELSTRVTEVDLEQANLESISVVIKNARTQELHPQQTSSLSITALSVALGE